MVSRISEPSTVSSVVLFGHGHFLHISPAKLWTCKGPMLLINLCNTPFCWRGVSLGLHHNSFKSNGPSSGRSNFWMSKKHPRNHVGNVHVGVIPWQALMNYCKLQWFTNFLGVCQLELDPKTPWSSRENHSPLPPSGCRKGVVQMASKKMSNSASFNRFKTWRQVFS